MDVTRDAAAEAAEKALIESGNRLHRNSVLREGLSAVAGVLAVVGLGALSVDTSGLFRQKDVAASQSGANDDTALSVRQLRAEVRALRQTQDAISRLPANDKMAIQIAALSAKVDSIAEQQDRLEQAIQSSPEKALAMPLMRRDMDNMRDSTAQNIAAVKSSVDQVYDLTKWLLGALAVGVFSLAIANFFQRKS